MPIEEPEKNVSPMVKKIQELEMRINLIEKSVIALADVLQEFIKRISQH